MKKKMLVSFLLVTLYFCGSSQQKAAQEQVIKTQDAIRPGTIGTTATGYLMQAKLNGKLWTASSMVSPEAAGRIVGYFGKNYIGLPYSKSDMVSGKKIMLGEDNAPDLSINNGCLWKDIKGELQITKVDAGAVEGKFYFTLVCGNNNETMKVTEGIFRIIVSTK